MAYDIQFVKGDVFSGEHAKVVAHGCNTVGAMGAGVAAIVREKYPRAHTEYQKLCKSRDFYPGAAQYVDVGWPWAQNTDQITGIYNLATQANPGPNADLKLIQIAFTNMAQHAAHKGIETIAIPRIGCGIGGLEWFHVEGAIRTALTVTPALLRAGKFYYGGGKDLTIVVHDLEVE